MMMSAKRGVIRWSSAGNAAIFAAMVVGGASHVSAQTPSGESEKLSISFVDDKAAKPTPKSTPKVAAKTAGASAEKATKKPTAKPTKKPASNTITLGEDAFRNSGSSSSSSAPSSSTSTEASSGDAKFADLTTAAPNAEAAASLPKEAREAIDPLVTDLKLSVETAMSGYVEVLLRLKFGVSPTAPLNNNPTDPVTITPSAAFASTDQVNGYLILYKMARQQNENVAQAQNTIVAKLDETLKDHPIFSRTDEKQRAEVKRIVIQKLGLERERTRRQSHNEILAQGQGALELLVANSDGWKISGGSQKLEFTSGFSPSDRERYSTMMREYRSMARSEGDFFLGAAAPPEI